MCTLVNGKIADRNGSFITVNDVLKGDDDKPYVFDASNAAILICEKECNRGVRVGTILDLEDYNHFNTDYDTIEYIKYQQLMCIFVYK